MRRTSLGCAPKTTHPFFAFLADHQGSLTDLILSYLDLWFCCQKDRTAVLACWKSLGGDEDALRRGYGDDVAGWEGVTGIRGGRVTELRWERKRLTGTFPTEIRELDGLTLLALDRNRIHGHLPSEIGKLTSLRYLRLGYNRLKGPLPADLGDLTALNRLRLHQNNFTGEVPSTLANLTNIKVLTLGDNNWSTRVPSWYLHEENAQEYLAKLRPNHGTLK